MQDFVPLIDKLFIEIFNDILTIEEITLKTGHFNDLTVKEMHTIEAIGLHGQKTAGEVARELEITLGTLTVAINSLIKKNYVERTRSESDRRIVNLGLTKKGRLLFRAHRHFHHDLAKRAISGFEESETLVLAKSLQKLHDYLSEYGKDSDR